MAENCFYMMHIKGDKNAIDEFVGMMKNGEMGRFFSVEAEMDSGHEAIVSGDCAWSLSSAVLLSGTNRLVEPTFLNKMRKLGFSIEAYTEEPVAGFEEHFVFDKGVIAIKETLLWEPVLCSQQRFPRQERMRRRVTVCCPVSGECG